MNIDYNKEQIQKKLLEDIKLNLHGKKWTTASALSVLNGLARMQLKVIDDFDRSFDVISSTMAKQLIYSLYIERNEGKDSDAYMVYSLYKNNLLEDFSSNVNFDVFLAYPLNENEVDREVTKLAYRVLKNAVSKCAREKEGEPSREELDKSIKDYNMAKRILSEGLGEEITEKKGEKGEEKVNSYINKIMHDLVECEVDYFSNLVEYIIRAHSVKELDRQAKEREEIDRDLAYYDRTIR